MQSASYILKTEERIDVFADPKSAKRKKGIAIILCVILIGSFILRDNLFAELSLLAKAILIGLIISCIFFNKMKTESFPLEIHFFDEYLEIHRMKVPYENGEVQREYFKFIYSDNPCFVYGQRTEFMKIRGFVHCKFFLYRKDGTLQEKPVRERKLDGICYFYADAKIVAEIESHSPIKVLVENN